MWRRLSNYPSKNIHLNIEVTMEPSAESNYTPTEKVIPINAFTCMYVASEQVKERVIEILNNNDIDFPPPYINVMDIWFV